MLSLISNGFTKDPILQGSFKDGLIYATYINANKSGVYHEGKYSIVKDYILKIDHNILMSKFSIYLCSNTIKCLHTFNYALSNIKILNDRVLYMFEKGGYGWYDMNTHKLEDVYSYFNNPIVNDACLFKDTLVLLKNNKLFKIEDIEIDLNQSGNHLAANNEMLLLWDIDKVYYTSNLNEFSLLQLNVHAVDIAVIQFNGITHFIVLGFHQDQLKIQFYVFNKQLNGPYSCLMPHGDKLLRRLPNSIQDLFSFNSPEFFINELLNTNLKHTDLFHYCLELPKEDQTVLINQFKVKCQDLRYPLHLSTSNDAVYIFCRRDIICCKPSPFVQLLLHKHPSVSHFIPNFKPVLNSFYQYFHTDNFEWQFPAICRALMLPQSNHYKQCLIPNPQLIVASHSQINLVELITYLVDHIDQLLRSWSYKTNNTNLLIAMLHELNFNCFVILGICCQLCLTLNNFQDIVLDPLLDRIILLGYKSGIVEWLIRHHYEDSNYLNHILTKNEFTSVYALLFGTSLNQASINHAFAPLLLDFKQCPLLAILPKVAIFQFLYAIEQEQPQLLVHCASYLSEDNSLSASTPMRHGFSIRKVLSLFNNQPLTTYPIPPSCSATILLNYIKCIHCHYKKLLPYVLHALMPIYFNKCSTSIIDNDMIHEFFDLGTQIDFNYCLLVLLNVDEPNDYYRKLIMTIIDTNNMDMLSEFHTVIEHLLKVALEMYSTAKDHLLIIGLFHCICRSLLINKNYDLCIQFIEQQQTELQILSDVKIFNLILEGIHLKQSCKLLLDQSINENEVELYELKMQYYLEHHKWPTHSNLATYCFDKNDLSAAFQLDSKMTITQLGSKNEIIVYKGLLTKSITMLKLEIKEKDIRELLNCKVPNYILHLKRGDVSDLIQIALNNNYMDEAKELAEQAVLYTNLGLCFFKNNGIISAVNLLIIPVLQRHLRPSYQVEGIVLDNLVQYIDIYNHYIQKLILNLHF